MTARLHMSWLIVLVKGWAGLAETFCGIAGFVERWAISLEFTELAHEYEGMHSTFAYLPYKIVLASLHHMPSFLLGHESSAISVSQLGMM